MGIPVLIGVLTGNLAEGTLGATGAWASLYGFGQPARRKAWTIIAAGVALVVGIALGIIAIGNPLLSLVLVSLFGAVITLVANALAFGPPGPYMLMLASAVGTSLWPQRDQPLVAMAIVAGGAALSLVIQSLPGLLDPTGPERRTVEAAESAVATLGDSPTRGDLSRAYEAVEAAWVHLRSAARGTVVRGHERHDTPARQVRPARVRELDERALEALHTVASLSVRIDHRTDLDGGPVQTGRIPSGPSLGDLLVDAVLRPHSLNRIAALRVLIGCLVAGALGMLVPFGQPYWAMAAATLLLSSNVGLRPNLLKGLNRAVGTGLGIVIAFLILVWNPQGLALLLVLMALQFTIETIVTRNYAVAATFITPLALTMASVNIDETPAWLVSGRGIDTAIGLAIGVIVLLTVAPLASRRRIETRLLDTLDAVATPLVMLGIRADMDSSTGTRQRQRLTRRVTALSASHRHAMSDSRTVADHAREAEADVTDVTALAYDVLATGRKDRTSRAEIAALNERLGTLSARVLAVQQLHDTAPIETLPDEDDEDWIALPDRG